MRRRSSGSVIGVVGGCGGVGASTFAAVLALVASPAVLVDLDVNGGGIDVVLGIEQAPGARWSGLRLEGGRLDPTSLGEGLPRSVRALRNEGYDFAKVVLYVGAPLAAVLLIALVADLFRKKPEEQPAAPAAFDPMAGGYPVPPLPGQELPPVPRRRRRTPQLQDALNGADHSEGS